MQGNKEQTPPTLPTWQEWSNTMFRVFTAFTGVVIWFWYGLCLLFVPQDFPWVAWAQQHSIIKHIQVVGLWFVLVGLLKIESATRNSPGLRRFTIALVTFTTLTWIITRETIAIASGAGYLEAPILWVYVLGCSIISVTSTSPGNALPNPADMFITAVRGIRHGSGRLWRYARRVFAWAGRRGAHE
jgi:hypothetical protein